MSCQCLNPVLAYSLGINPDTGKRLISFKVHVDDDIHKLKEKYGSDNVFTLPCGRCESCRKNYAEEWTIRCQLESFYHQYNYFITLTFDDWHLRKACYKDFQRFLDRLEGRGHKNKITYLCCEEYGEITQRYHLHAILFLDFPLTLVDEVQLGSFKHYHSKEIKKLWKFGLHDVALFDRDCGRYVAKYTTKTDKGHRGLIHMSRNIGKQWIIDNFDKVLHDNFKIYMNIGNKKQYYFDCSKVLINWFRELGCLEVEDFVNFRKSIGHLSNISKVQLVGGKVEEEGIAYAKLLAQSKNQQLRRK